MGDTMFYEIENAVIKNFNKNELLEICLADKSIPLSANADSIGVGISFFAALTTKKGMLIV